MTRTSISFLAIILMLIVSCKNKDSQKANNNQLNIPKSNTIFFLPSY